MVSQGNAPNWRDVDCWVFDLDNTLYHPSVGLLDQVNILMTGFIEDRLKLPSEEASRLRRTYWQRHGATMVGLHREHGIEPEEFLAVCHDLDLSGLKHDAALDDAISGLPGRKIVHTNGPRHHAERVLNALGLPAHFERIISVEDTGYVPKPARDAHQGAVDIAGIVPSRAAMIEDSPANLVHPSRMGMRTIWIDDDQTPDAPDHIDYTISDLTEFLQTVVAAAP